MAESDRKVSSSSDSKEKKSMLDDDIGKEFLSSWKSMSAAENDTMDFGFDTIPSGKKSSGKKSAFDFGKLDDMDFSLDNDFGKFNIDIPDLDFSNSTKKVAKPKDQREGESSSKNHKEKDGPFSFSFDFNDMDDFNLDSTLIKRENAPKSILERKIAASDKSELRDSSIDLDVDGKVAAFDEGQNKKVSASESVLKSNKNVLRGSSFDQDMDGGDAAFNEGQNKKVSATGSVLKADKSVLRGSSIDLDIYGGVAALDEGRNKKVSASESMLKSNKSDIRGSSIDLDVDGAAFGEGKNKKVSASGSVLKPDVETALGSSENREVSIEKSPSNTFGSYTTSSSPDRNCTVSVNKEDQPVPLSTKTSPAVPSAKDTSQVSPGQSLGGNDSSKDDGSNAQMEVDSLESKLHPQSVLQHSGNDGIVTNIGSEQETSELKDSDSPYVIRDEHTEVESDTASTMAKENHLETESVACGSEIEAIPAAVVSPSMSKERTDNYSTQDCTEKISAGPESDQVVKKVKLIRERETGVVRSKFFRRSEEPEPQVCQPLPVNEKASNLESQGTAVSTLDSFGNGKSKDLNEGESHRGRNTTGQSKSLSSDSAKGESALVAREKNVKNLSNIRVGLTETGNGSASKLPAKSRLLERELNKVNSVVLGSTKVREELNYFSGDNPAISTDRTSKPSCQTSENPKSLVPSTASKILSVGGSTAKNTNISSFKILRNLSSSRAQTDTSQEPNSFKNSQKGVEQRSLELPAKSASSKAQADALQEFSSLKNAQKSVELPVKFVSRKAQADTSLEFSSLKNAQKRVEMPEKPVSGNAQTDSSLKFSSLKNSQKTVELPSSKDQTDASQEFSSLKNSQKKVELPVKFVSSNAQIDASQEFSSLENLQKSVEPQIKFVSAATHPISKTQSNFPGIISLKHKTLESPTGEAVPLNPHKRLSQSPSLKRKTLEGPTGEAVPLNPHKRLSRSPKESRYSTDHIKNVVDELNNTPTVEGNGTTSEQEMPIDVIVKELEISLTMGNDGNAENAEAYAKELENICNMLKKKHEEAKEIMVRAIVNNNSLLMLNHPMFDEKIRNVEKLLTKLTMSS